MNEQNEDYLDFIKNEEESIIEKKINKQMEKYFVTLFEDVTHERSLTLLLSLTDPDIFKETGFTDHEINIIKNPASKNYRQETSRGHVALHLLD